MTPLKIIAGFALINIAIWNISIAYGLSSFIAYTIMFFVSISIVKLIFYVKRNEERERELKEEYEREQLKKKEASNDSAVVKEKADE